ncbi:MAG: hypothetical protein K9H61_12265 [Bacteroidia bacterium]|nr:hypothetical protein [Bacteroidia bacterium]MCF8447759.1 hypothetical protein [Bacteroidia bacterium]
MTKNRKIQTTFLSLTLLGLLASLLFASFGSAQNSTTKALILKSKATADILSQVYLMEEVEAEGESEEIRTEAFCSIFPFLDSSILHQNISSRIPFHFIDSSWLSLISLPIFLFIQVLRN